MVGKFADDTKTVDSDDVYLRLQQDLDQLSQWAEERQMEWYSDKYEVLDFYRTNQGRT